MTISFCDQGGKRRYVLTEKSPLRSLFTSHSRRLAFFHSLTICHWISFMFLLYDRCICTHSIDPSLADGEFPGLGLALVPEAEHEAEISSNFCPGWGLNLGPRSIM